MWPRLVDRLAADFFQIIFDELSNVRQLELTKNHSNHFSCKLHGAFLCGVSTCAVTTSIHPNPVSGFGEAIVDDSVSMLQGWFFHEPGLL